MEAALNGAKEIGFTIMSMTLSLAAVFIPVLFMGGVVGRLLHEFAVTIGAAVLVSGFVSLTLTPMLCSRFLRPPHAGHSKLYRASERFFEGMLHVYDATLKWVRPKRAMSWGSIFSMCSIRKRRSRRPLACVAASYASKVTRTARPPMACVMT